MKRIKLATVIGKMKGGGVEHTVMQYLEHLNRETFDLALIVDQDSTLIPYKELSDMGVRLFLIPPYQKIMANHNALYRLFQEEKYDIVHAHINTLNVFPMCAAARAGVPVRISHNHSTMSNSVTKENIAKCLLRPFAKLFPTVLCACGEYSGRWIYGDNTQFYCMPNSIDFNWRDYRFSEEVREAVRRELGISGKFVVGHVGRFVKQKNHEFLIEVFSEVLKRCPEAELLLIGNGDLLYAVQEKADKMGITDHIIFAGQRGDMMRMYQAMDILVFPSLYEGLPLIPVEAQASGLHVLSSDVVSHEIVHDDSLVDFLPLSVSAKVWANKVIEIRKRDKGRRTIDIDFTRKSNSSLVCYVSAEHLSDWYCNLVR